MKKFVVAGLVAVGVLVTAFVGLLLFGYFVNRTVDQNIAADLRIACEWIEISPEPPLTAFRRSQELAIALPDYHHNPSEPIVSGSFQLPDGRTVSPEIEGIDQFGNQIAFRHGGFTMSRRDLVIYRSKDDMDAETKITKIRIRSGETFVC